MATIPEADLDSLMTRLADGDRAVFRPLYERLREPIERLCQNMLGPTADARDAFQEAMQKIFERAPVDYDRRRPALPWALALAGWECRTLRRRRQRRREDAGALREGEGGEFVDRVAATAASSQDAETRLAERELQEAVVAVLGTLSPADRETLQATFWEEAGPQGATFRKRRERALARLRQAWRRTYGLS
jgi:RNA polymerase sigma-70 factor (ECF subfamily)